MKQFIVHWLDRKKELLEGSGIVDAFNRAGISAGALPAVDYYEEVKLTDRARERIQKVIDENGEYFVERHDLRSQAKARLFGLVEDRSNRSGDKIRFVPSRKEE